MTISSISNRTLLTVQRSYRQQFGLRAHLFSTSGSLINDAATRQCVFRLPSTRQTLAYSLQEALHWGEPYVFYWTTGVISWVVALVDQNHVHGGIVSDAVIGEGHAQENAVRELREQGLNASDAGKIIKQLPTWTGVRIREAAFFLQNIFYQISGWRPLLLEENRVKATQQRQINAAIDERKKSGRNSYPIDKERMLLTLIRAGDQNSARRVLNEMLGAMYYFSPKLVVLRARAIELMGYLTRAAVEDSPIMEPLIERNHQWMQKLIKAPDFETLSLVLMKALDDFMEGIYARGFNCYNPTVGRIMDYIARNYTQSVTLKDVANAIGLSTFRVSHLVKQQTGKTFLQHVTQMRINKARELLTRTNTACPEIAYAVGFCDQSYFIKHFKLLMGTTPARYRRASHTPVDKPN